MRAFSLSVMASVLALSLGASSLAQAQPGGDRHGPRDRAHAHGNPGPGQRWEHRHRPPPPPPMVRPGHRPPPGPAWHGSGPQRRWVVGSHVPRQYRAPQYYVHDWRRRGLYAPPQGYRWVRYNGDYLLVAIATGLIANLVLQAR